MPSVIELCKKIFAAEVLFIIGYNILVYPYVNAKDQGFQMGLTMLTTSAAIIEKQPLIFPDTIAGQNLNLRTKPKDDNAAVFSAMGIPNSRFRAQVVEKKIWLTTGDGADKTKRIKVNKFRTGGDVNRRGRGRFDVDGKATNIRVGATAHVRPNDIPGAYEGSATFRITYM